MSDMPANTGWTTMVVAGPTIQMESGVMAIVGDDGRVQIDWAAVEKNAGSRDNQLGPLARALLAVRNNTWEPLAAR